MYAWTIADWIILTSSGESCSVKLMALFLNKKAKFLIGIPWKIMNGFLKNFKNLKINLWIFLRSFCYLNTLKITMIKIMFDKKIFICVISWNKIRKFRITMYYVQLYFRICVLRACFRYFAKVLQLFCLGLY